MTYQLNKKIFISGRIHCLTGLHIGGSTGAMSIGGNDNPIIRNPRNNEPYIPGSSLKGKMRSLLELAYGNLGNQKMGVIGHGPNLDFHNRSTKLFGNAVGKKDEQKTNEQRPSRLIVRDGRILAKPEDVPHADMPFTEIKTEVVIDRVTSAAMPRPLERVPGGIAFTLDLVLNVFNEDNENELLEDTFRALLLVQDDYLGGSGSRGSGQVRFEITELKQRTAQDYIDNAKASSLELPQGSVMAERLALLQQPASDHTQPSTS